VYTTKLFVALLIPRADRAADNLRRQELENAARSGDSAIWPAVQIDPSGLWYGGWYAATAAPTAAQGRADGAQIFHSGPLLRVEAANAQATRFAAQGVNCPSFSKQPHIAGGQRLLLLGQNFNEHSNRLVRYAKNQRQGTGILRAAWPGSCGPAGAVMRSSGAIRRKWSHFCRYVDLRPLANRCWTAPYSRLCKKLAMIPTVPMRSSSRRPRPARCPLFAELLQSRINGGQPHRYIGLTTLGHPLRKHWRYAGCSRRRGSQCLTLVPQAPFATLQRPTANTPRPVAGLAFGRDRSVGPWRNPVNPMRLSARRLTQGAGFPVGANTACSV